jgi:aspartate ammonia-lyase
MASTPCKTRKEHDLLGERKIPDRCYYGIQTLRAVENFPITGVSLAHYPEMIRPQHFGGEKRARPPRE